ncbi:MAG: hypothetical protein L0Y48_03545 [Fusobacteria bacterium]|nr:hypothetical protein [Fusobacteriota bacterium]
MVDGYAKGVYGVPLGFFCDQPFYFFHYQVEVVCGYEFPVYVWLLF